MNSLKVVQAIKAKFQETGSPADIPLQKGGTFSAKRTNDGILVDNLGGQAFLPWIVFQEVICVLLRNGGRAPQGNATSARLGQDDLPLDSIEGHIALVVYGKKEGQPVFRRITPVAGILVWAGVCSMEPGELILRQS